MREILWKIKIPCKMKKAEISGRLRAQKCPEWVNQGFLLSELAKVLYARRKSFQTLCLFPFFVWKFASCRIFARKRRNFQTKFGYSVVKQHKNEKERWFSQVSFENFRVTAPKTILSFLVKLAKFLCFGSGNLSRSRFFKSFCRDGLARPFSVDNLNFQYRHTNSQTRPR